MTTASSPGAKKRAARRHVRQSALGANQVSPVKVTKADGTVEIQQPYTRLEVINLTKRPAKKR